MSETCTHDCASCAQNCNDRTAENAFLAQANAGSNIKKIIGIVSGKGGVGKSLVTSLLAAGMNQRGFQTAIMDADITGPSIPKAFGIKEKAEVAEGALLPVESADGIKVMSLNLITENDTDPVIWRGPVIAGTVKQFYTEVTWGDVDYMFVDMPPGTGDVPLTVFQSMPLDGIVVVTSPQELVSMIVAKAVNMAKAMNVPILGLVENMSYLECPDCGKKLPVFGESHIEEVAASYAIDTYAQIPITPAFAKAVDAGTIGELKTGFLDGILDIIEK